MAIRKEILHPENDDSVDIYPKTSYDQVEGTPDLREYQEKNSLQQDIEDLGFEKVEGNPSESGSVNLTKIKIGNTVYLIPKGLDIKTIIVSNDGVSVGTDRYTSAKYVRFSPTSEQATILSNEDNQIIKLDLTALGDYAPAPYVWLRRNTVIALPNPLDPSSTISAYQFTCGGEQFWYENYQTDIAIKNIGNAALVYVPALGFADITLLNISVPNLYSSLGQIPKYQHNVTVEIGANIIKFSLRSASLDPITYIELKNKQEYYTSILLYSIVLMNNSIPAVISGISWDFSPINDMTIVVNGSNSYADIITIQENSTITDIVTQL